MADDLFISCQKRGLPEFSALFSSFEKEAFRFEILPFFTVPSETEAYHLYLQKAPRPEDFNKGWLDFLRKTCPQGKQVLRVRHLPQDMNDYLRFEIDWGYAYSLKAGEKIFTLKNYDLRDLENKVPILKDFWMMDQKRVFLMEYDLLGRFLGISEMPENKVPTYIHLREHLLAQATPLSP